MLVHHNLDSPDNHFVIELAPDLALEIGLELETFLATVDCPDRAINRSLLAKPCKEKPATMFAEMGISLDSMLAAPDIVTDTPEISCCRPKDPSSDLVNDRPARDRVTWARHET